MSAGILLETNGVMLKNDFTKLVEDILRDELMKLGMSYDDQVVDVEEQPSGDGCLIRLRGEQDDIAIVDQGAMASRDAVTAQVHRKLKAALLGTDPFAETPDL